MHLKSADAILTDHISYKELPTTSSSNTQSSSFWSYFKAELDDDQAQESFIYKNERVKNFLAVPMQL